MTERRHAPPDGLALAVRALRGGVAASGALVIVLFVWVVVARLLHPAADHEWMTGAVRDAVERVRQGLPLYEKPSATFIPFLYPPLYFWLAAAVARAFGTFAGAKIVSLLATGATCAGIARIARALGASRRWTTIALVLHVGAFGPTLWFYDLERVDATASALVVAGVAVLLGSEQERRAVVAGALLGLAPFAKQAGVFVFLATAATLFVAGERRRALLFTASGVVVLAVLGGWLHVSTDGWFSYYCFTLPRAHGIDASLAPLFFFVDVPKLFVLSAASVGLAAWGGWRLARRAPVPWRDAVFAGVLGAAMASALFHRAHVGGWANVLLAWTPLACAAFAVGATRVADGPRAEALVLGAVILQLCGWAFDPNEVAPGPSDDRNAARLEGLVRRLEQEGDVVVTTTGGVTRARHFHSAALFDVLRAGAAAPDDYLETIRARHYAALVVALPNDTPCQQPACKTLHEEIMRSYFVAGHLADPASSAMVGFDARPRWVLRPRKRSADHASYDELEARERRESAMAVQRDESRAPVERAAWTFHDDIEELASR